MTVVLYRIDERLIHGQVVIGWGTQLHPDSYLVVDDALAASDWEQELYVLGLPEEIQVEFLTVDEARARLPELREDSSRTLLLTRDLGTMLDLAKGGLLAREKVNLGGIHHAAGRVEVRPYLYLGETERAQLREIASEGVLVFARDLPGSPQVGLEGLLG